MIASVLCIPTVKIGYCSNKGNYNLILTALDSNLFCEEDNVKLTTVMVSQSKPEWHTQDINVKNIVRTVSTDKNKEVCDYKHISKNALKSQTVKDMIKKGEARLKDKDFLKKILALVDKKVGNETYVLNTDNFEFDVYCEVMCIF